MVPALLFLMVIKHWSKPPYIQFIVRCYSEIANILQRQLTHGVSP